MSKEDNGHPKLPGDEKKVSKRVIRSTAAEIERLNLKLQERWQDQMSQRILVLEGRVARLEEKIDLSHVLLHRILSVLDS